MEGNVKEVIEKTDNTLLENEPKDKPSKSENTEKIKEEEKETFTDSQEDEEKEEKTPNKTTEDVEKGKKTQTPEEREKFAKERREREARTKEIENVKKEAYEQALVDAVNSVNPYTKKEIKTPKDRQVFLKMRELEKSGHDPITDYYQYDDIVEPKTQEKAFDFKADGQNFKEKYPDVDLDTLIADDNFKKFSTKLIGKASLADIYETFIETKTFFETEADKKARRMIAKAKATPGGINSNIGSNEPSLYTLEQIKTMSKLMLVKIMI
jgi:hypothetical protein